MPDPRFYAVAGPFTLAEIAEAAGAELSADADPARRLSDVAPLSHATPEHVSFLANSSISTHSPPAAPAPASRRLHWPTARRLTRRS